DVVVYGDNFRTPSEGERLARIQAEALVATQAVYEARGTVYQMQPGFLFTLEQHPRASLNAEYLVTELEHRGKQVEGIVELDEMFGLEADRAYVSELRAIPSKVQFRAPRRTPWPRVDGVVDGIVDGDGDSPYAQVDEHGRYKMKVFFDESDLVDGSASTWVRMLQPHGGGTEGIHFPLRKSTEVHVVFLGGDPDRPVIVGVAPNAQKPSKVTAGNNTKNVIMTGGSNRFELEDADGGQWMNLSTPSLETFVHMGAGDYNMVQSTNGHGREFVGGNRDGHIVGAATQRVQGSMTGTYDSTVDNTVQGDVTESYNSGHMRTVMGATQKTLMSTLTETINGAVTRLVNSTVGETIAGDVTRTLNSNLEETIQGNLTHTSVGTVTEVHSADKSTTIAGTHHLESAGAQTIESLAAQEVLAPTQTFTAEGVQAHNADTHIVSAGTEASVTSPTVIINADGSVTITSASVTILGSDCTMEGGSLTVNHGTVGITSGGVSVDGGGGIDMTAGIIKLN
ncbi:MAG: type VI secretion system tip protein VgrG, partial [Polyangiaceae bacterium]